MIRKFTRGKQKNFGTVPRKGGKIENRRVRARQLWPMLGQERDSTKTMPRTVRPIIFRSISHTVNLAKRARCRDVLECKILWRIKQKYLVIFNYSVSSRDNFKVQKNRTNKNFTNFSNQNQNFYRLNSFIKISVKVQVTKIFLHYPQNFK